MDRAKFAVSTAFAVAMMASPSHAFMLGSLDFEDYEIETFAAAEVESMFSAIVSETVEAADVAVMDFEDAELEDFAAFFSEIADPQAVEQVQTVVSAPPVVSAPLPAGLPLALSALAGLLFISRRRRS